MVPSRRKFLATAGVLMSGGCLEYVRPPWIHVLLVNWHDERHGLTVRILDGDQILFDRTYELDPDESIKEGAGFRGANLTVEAEVRNEGRTVDYHMPPTECDRYVFSVLIDNAGRLQMGEQTPCTP